ncbi:MAG: hypothetical protein HYU28_01695 [Actinobacteria bacterium]|nr:hypothetical protein [Actinomycetota bacterium]
MRVTRDHRLGDDNQNGAEEGQEHLAFDVHDGPSQGLVAINLIVRDHLERFEMPEATRDLLARVEQLACESKAQLDAIVEGMLLDPVGESDLVSALRDLAATVGGDGGPVVEIKIEGEPCRLSADAVRALYRVAEGSIVNAWRHGAATRVEIEVEYGDDLVGLWVTDDGPGLGPTGLEEGRGLRGMRHRLEQVGGRFKVTVGYERGVVVEGSVPKEDA